jgi:hypothetical protein
MPTLDKISDGELVMQLGEGSETLEQYVILLPHRSFIVL